MKKMLFISRHTPTQRQVELALEKGFGLVHVGDVDAFDSAAVRALVEEHKHAAVCCVHPAIALGALDGTPCQVVGVFENANRAPEGAPPRFEAKALHVWEVFGLDLEIRVLKR
jgi:hypothetical protein